MGLINTSKCENCEFGKVDEENKAKVMVFCALKNKTYYFGQNIQCDKEKLKNDN